MTLLSPLRLLAVLVHLGGAAAAASAAIELGDAASPAAHALGAVRGAALLAAATLAVLSTVGAAAELAWRRPIRACVLRDLLLLAVAAIAAQVVLSPSYKPVLARLAFGGAAAAFALLRVGDAQLARARSTRAVRVAERTAFQACLALVLLELGLRGLAALWPTPLLARDDDSIHAAIDRYRYRPGTVRYGFACNQGGHYDAEFARAPWTVVAIGDSFSQGVVPWPFHFTTICERCLAPGVAVHNLGHAGIGPAEYLHLLRTEGVQLAPDLIVVDLFAGNDLYESARLRDERGLLRSLCDRRNVLAWQVPLRLWRVWRAGFGRRAEGRGAGALQGEDLLTEVVTDEARLRAVMPWLDDPLREAAAMAEEEFLRIEAERAERIAIADRHGWYDMLFAALAELRAAAGAVPLAVLLIPDELQVEEALAAVVATRLRGMALDRDEPQRRIGQWLAERDIPCLDLLPVLRAVPRLPDGRRHLYHRCDTHWNARGNRVAGEALAEFLRRLRG